MPSPPRAMSIAEVMDEAFRIYRAAFAGILPLGMLFAGIPVVLTYTIVTWAPGVGNLDTLMAHPERLVQPTFFLATVLWWLLDLGCLQALAGAVTWGASVSRAGQDFDASSGLQAIAGRAGALAHALVLTTGVQLAVVAVGAVLVQAVLYGGTSMEGPGPAALGVVGVLVYAGLCWANGRMGLTLPALFVESAPAPVAFGRSWRLTSDPPGARFPAPSTRAFLVATLGLAPAVIGPGVVMAALLALGWHVPSLLGPVAVMAALTRPFFAVTMAVYYVDCRVRREGLDLALAAEGGAQPSP